MKEEFNFRKTLKDIEKYALLMSNDLEEDKKRTKIFYNIDELSGWRFFRKAIKYKDWKSIIHYNLF